MPDEPSKNPTPTPDKKPQPSSEQGPKLLRRSETHIEAYGGPLPPPALLKEFDNVIPGAAERILKMAERQADHRQFLEKTVVSGDSKRAFCGLFVGAFVALCVLGGAVFLIHDGHDAAGATIAGLDVASLVSVFVYGSISRRSERADKTKGMNASAGTDQS